MSREGGISEISCGMKLCFFFPLDNRTGPPSDSLCHSFLRKYQRHNSSEEFIAFYRSVSFSPAGTFECLYLCIRLYHYFLHVRHFKLHCKPQIRHFSSWKIVLYDIVHTIHPIQNNLASKHEIAALNMGRCDLTSGFRIVVLAFLCAARKYLYIKNVRMSAYATTKAHLCLWTAVLYTWCSSQHAITSS